METEKAIEELKNKYRTEYLDDNEVEFLFKELEKKGKMIDLTIEYLANNGVEKDICIDEISKNCNDNCYECIKQYFENKANEESE